MDYAPELTRQQRAMCARFARKYELERADCEQELQLIMIARAGDFDAGRGATRATFYMNCLRGSCIRQRAQQRFGVSLDEDKTDEEIGAAGDKYLLEAERAHAELTGAGGEIEVWRTVGNSEIAHNATMLSDRDRKIVERMTNGKTAQEIADEIGLTKRRVNQVLAELRELYQAGVIKAGAGQLELTF